MEEEKEREERGGGDERKEGKERGKRVKWARDKQQRQSGRELNKIDQVYSPSSY